MREGLQKGMRKPLGVMAVSFMLIVVMFSHIDVKT